MKGLSSSVTAVLEQKIDSFFNHMSYSLFGPIPKLKNKISISFIFESIPTLAHIFTQAMGNKVLTYKEEELLKELLNTSHGFVEALKEKTKSDLIGSVSSYVKEKRLKQEAPAPSMIKEILDNSMEKAKKHFIMITESESTKARNMGKASDIIRVGTSMGIDDPHVFFVVVKDNVTCDHCKNNHLMEDGVTPRVFKLSEVKMGYLSSADRKAGEVSIAGIHPHCRCSMTYLSPGFGFKNGRIAFISPKHNEHEAQNSKA